MSVRKLVSGGTSVLFLFSGAAFADEQDTVQFQASQAFQRDSNIFRLSDQANTQALLGRPERSDMVSTTKGGILFNKPYGLQRFEAGLSVERYSYNRFSNLNFTALNYAAAWRWSLTPALHGNLTTDRREFVDNSADVQSQGRVNRRTNRATVLDAEYEIDGRWRALGGVVQRDTKNSQPFTFEGDSKINSFEVGTRYQFPFSTSLAYLFRNGKGEYGNIAFPGVSGSNFKDREHELRGDWRPTGGRSIVQGRVAYLDRKHDTIGARDFSGLTAQIDWNYQLTGKTSALTGLVREIGSYQTNNSSYFVGTRVFFGPTWQATDKIALKARYDYGVRDFKGPLPGFVATNRSDKLHLGSVSAEYQALRALKLMAWFQLDRRTSNEAGADYKSNAVGISAQASF